MPREVIIQSRPPVEHPALDGNEDHPATSGGVEVHHGLAIGWNKMGWMQVYVTPHDSDSTGEWHVVEMTRDDANRLIRTVRKARDAAFGADA